MCPRRQLDEMECAKKFKVDLAFKMLSCGRTDLVPHALQLLPATKVSTVSYNTILHCNMYSFVPEKKYTSHLVQYMYCTTLAVDIQGQ